MVIRETRLAVHPAFARVWFGGNKWYDDNPYR